MKIKMHYCEVRKTALQKTLEKYNIPFEFVDGGGVCPDMLAFDVYSDNERIDELKELLPNTYTSQYIFTQQELSAAEWLTMRSTNNKLEAVNTEKTFEFSCPYTKNLGYGEIGFAHHRRQVMPYEFRAPIKWGKNHFYSSFFCGFSTIFCDTEAKAVLDEAKAKGVEFKDVIWHKKSMIMDNVYQMSFTNRVPMAALELNNGFKEMRCPQCGAVSYSVDAMSRLCVKKTFLGDSDFYCTDEVFGDGFGEPINIVSNRIYTILSEKKMARNIEFQPLIVI